MDTEEMCFDIGVADISVGHGSGHGGGKRGRMGLGTCMGPRRVNSGISSHELGKEVKFFFGGDIPRVRVYCSPSSKLGNSGEPSVNLQPKKWRFPELAENELGECRRETSELGECARTRGMRGSKSGKGQGDFGTRGSAFGSRER